MTIQELRDFVYKKERPSTLTLRVELEFPEIYSGDEVVLELLESDLPGHEKKLILMQIVRPVFRALQDRAWKEPNDFTFPPKFEPLQKFMYLGIFGTLTSKLAHTEWPAEIDQAMKVLYILFKSGRIMTYEDQPEFIELEETLAKVWKANRDKNPRLNEYMDD